jgi:hypothetical protein
MLSALLHLLVVGRSSDTATDALSTRSSTQTHTSMHYDDDVRDERFNHMESRQHNALLGRHHEPVQPVGAYVIDAQERKVWRMPILMLRKVKDYWALHDTSNRE